MQNGKIIDRFLSNVGLITNIFGKYSDRVVFDTDKEKAKLFLFHIHGYKNIFEILPQEVDNDKLTSHVKTLMQMYETPNELQTPNK